uniref:Uncharacterized protein n=1 Tax=Oryza brachyantha TaxID=4533 RepID=J3MHU6_ORYBR
MEMNAGPYVFRFGWCNITSFTCTAPLYYTTERQKEAAERAATGLKTGQQPEEAHLDFSATGRAKTNSTIYLTDPWCMHGHGVLPKELGNLRRHSHIHQLSIHSGVSFHLTASIYYRPQVQDR